MNRPEDPGGRAESPTGQRGAEGAVRTETFPAAELEEKLRAALAYERRRSEELERELDATRRSESFRVGHAIVTGVNSRLLWRLPLIRELVSRAVTRYAEGGGGAGSHRRGLRQRLTRPNRKNAARSGTVRRNCILFVAWDLAADEAAGPVEQVWRLQTTLSDVHPVFLTNSLLFDVLEARGYEYEYVIPLNEWADHRPAHEWPAYVTARVAAVRRQHRPVLVVLLGGNESRALDQGVLNPIIIPRLAESSDNLLSGH